MKQGSKGFSLIEWLLVIAFFCIFIAIVKTLVSKFLDREPNYKNDPDLGELSN